MNSRTDIEIAQPQMPGLTPEEFRGVASVYLDGTNLLHLVTGVELSTDSDGLIAPHVSNNLRTTFSVAERMTPDPEVRDKCAKMLGLWATETQENTE